MSAILYERPPAQAIDSLNAQENGVNPNALIATQTAQWKTFLEKCNTEGKNAYIPKGNYKSEALTFNFGLNIIWAPGCTIEHTGYWTFNGKKAAGVELTAETKQGSNLWVHAALALTVGQIVLVETATEILGETGVGRNRGQLVEVVEVISATEFRSRETAYRTFTAFAGADKTKVALVTPINFQYLGSPLCFNYSRSGTDGETREVAAKKNIFKSATGAFTAADVGSVITAKGMKNLTNPGGLQIKAVLNSKEVELFEEVETLKAGLEWTLRRDIGFLTVNFGKNVKMEIFSEGQLQYAAGANQCFGANITSRSTKGEWNNLCTFGYSVAILGGTCHWEVNTQTVNGAYDFTTSTVNNESGEPYDGRVVGINNGSTSSGAFSTHPSGHDILFDHCIAMYSAESIFKTGVAFSSSCENVTFSGCYARGAFQGGEIAQYAKAKTRFLNCTFRECNTGLIIRGGKNHEVAGCLFEEIEGLGIRGSEGNAPAETQTLRGYNQHNNTFRLYGTAKPAAEGCAFRFTKELKNCVIQDETIFAGGAGEELVGRIDVKAEKSLIQRVTVKERIGTSWLKIAAVTTAIKTGEGEETEVEGVKIRACYVEA